MSTSTSSWEKEETARGRTSVREPPKTGILLVKPLKAWNEGKANIPVAWYIEARVIPCLDGVASWIMETPLLWCGLYMHPNGHIRTRREGTPLPKNDDLAGVSASDEDDLGIKSTSVAQPTINMIPSPALEDESNTTTPFPSDGSA
ncbi:hypothetical protein NEOLEDRAFT_1183262 [Neolentinus lepideus HHB14362 ss-1]|uniref:Uncharacterized protein n=1 Tax=Neolentinus lepideus HHB14362 ss-1 TaxID=1314782 RepID=A0A165NFA2_9AGAM|nr:hypothetical protein NEOLEDRAFT_1183262 [Neolentinus lepideus HHB14362 ss-1]